MPWCDTDAMAAHLIEISAAVDPGAHAVLIVDQAGWHLTPKLAIPDNITVLALPPRSPELNPVENVWQFMRDNWLSNRIFKSYEDIVALCCQAWNNLIDQPWKIMSLGMRKWAHPKILYVVSTYSYQINIFHFLLTVVNSSTHCTVRRHDCRTVINSWRCFGPPVKNMGERIPVAFVINFRKC